MMSSWLINSTSFDVRCTSQFHFGAGKLSAKNDDGQLTMVGSLVCTHTVTLSEKQHVQQADQRSGYHRSERISRRVLLCGTGSLASLSLPGCSASRRDRLQRPVDVILTDNALHLPTARARQSVAKGAVRSDDFEDSAPEGSAPPFCGSAGRLGESYDSDLSDSRFR